MTLPRFVVSPEQLLRSRVVLCGDELHHLRVRRTKVGAAVVLIDGSGREVTGTVVGITDSEATIAIEQASDPRPPGTNESRFALTLAQAVLKSDKTDLVVQKATELGVHEIILHVSERCIARPSADRVSRWERIARAAAKQCQRTQIPRICGPVTFSDFVHGPRRGDGLLFWENAPRTARWPDTPGASLVAVVGPEGGFTEAEVNAACSSGFTVVGLGPRVLRAETAAIAAIVLCQQRWGDMTAGR